MQGYHCCRRIARDGRGKSRAYLYSLKRRKRDGKLDTLEAVRFGGLLVRFTKSPFRRRASPLNPCINTEEFVFFDEPAFAYVTICTHSLKIAFEDYLRIVGYEKSLRLELENIALGSIVPSFWFENQGAREGLVPVVETESGFISIWINFFPNVEPNVADFVNLIRIELDTNNP